MRNLILILIPLLFAGCMATPKGADWALVIHGGAGTIERGSMTQEKESQYRSALTEALEAGAAVLANGGSSAEAVEATIHIMEDSPLFNSGKGAVFTSEGTVELDASFMDGATGNAGAVAGVKTVRHPISAARMVMDSSVHVMMAGNGADQFARQMGLEIVSNEYFFTDRRHNQLKRIQEQEQGTMLDHDSEGATEGMDPLDKKHGTVGCVALDMAGNLAAGTSTGGMTNKRFGRVGDSPVIGAGTYADNATCGVSCTGHGEYFIRNVVAYDVAARMKYLGESVATAADHVVNKHLVEQGGTGGLIAMDAQGNIAMPFNTAGMYRGYLKADGEIVIEIYRD